jgi:hypothetical protein
MINERGGGVCLELVEKVNVWTHGRRTLHSHKEVKNLLISVILISYS